MWSNSVLLIPISAIVGGIICSALGIYARYKQRMAMITRGIKREEKPYKRGRLLIVGSCMMAIGFALLLGLRSGNVGLGGALVILFVGAALTVLAGFILREPAPLSCQITQRGERMRTLLNRLNAFRKTDCEVTIRVTNGEPVEGKIKAIEDDELLEFKEDSKDNPTYIPVDKIVSIHKIKDS